MRLRKHLCDGDFYEIEDVDKLIAELAALVEAAFVEGDRYTELYPFERSEAKEALDALLEGISASPVRTQ